MFFKTSSFPDYSYEFGEPRGMNYRFFPYLNEGSFYEKLSSFKQVKKNIQQFLYTRDLATRKFLFDLQAQVLLLAQRKFLSVQEYMYFFHSLDRTFFQYILHKYNRILVGEKIHITVFKYP